MDDQHMRGWALTAFGKDTLRLGRLPMPRPGLGEVLVRVHAVSLNYRDRMVMEGRLLPALPEMPFIPVSDFVGEVVEAGSAVTRVAPGDRVMGNFWTGWLSGPAPRDLLEHGRTLGGPLQGALAEYVVIPEDVAVAVPPSLSDAEAATLPVAGLTAWFALTEDGGTAPGDVVVVQGTGGVALAALQLATALGARVIVLSRSSEKLARIAGLAPWGTIDTTADPDWERRVLAMTDGRGADHVLEIIGGETLARSVGALAPEGRISLIGLLGGDTCVVPTVPLMLRRARIRGVSVGHRASFEAMVAMVAEKEIHPVIDSIHPFEDALAAFARLEAGPVGKVVVSVAEAA